MSGRCSSKRKIIIRTDAFKNINFFYFLRNVEITFVLIIAHLKVLNEKTKKYSPSLSDEKYNWVRNNPLAVTSNAISPLYLTEQHNNFYNANLIVH